MKAAILSVLLLFSAAGISQQQVSKSREGAIANWRSLVPAIKNVLKENNLICDYAGGWEPRIADAADFSSSDHMTVALVDWCAGGASTDSIVAMNLQNGKPVISRFLNAKNQPQTIEFLDGSSVTHADGVELVPESNAILSFHWVGSEERTLDCGVNAFVWQPQLRAFKLEPGLSTKATQSRCQPRSPKG